MLNNYLNQLILLLFICGILLLPFAQLPIAEGTRPVSWLFWFIPLVFICLTRISKGKIYWKELPFFMVLLLFILYLPITFFSVDLHSNIISLYVERVTSLIAGFGMYFLVITRFGGIVSLEMMKRAYIMIFLPVTTYGLFIQVPAVLGVAWFIGVNETVRSLLSYFSTDIGKLSWFASEPSFAAFQIVSVIGVILLLNKQRLWHKVYLLILILSLLFTKSIYGLILLMPLIIIGLLACRRSLIGKLLIMSVSLLFIIVMYLPFTSTSIPSVSRIENITSDPSATHRYLLLKSTFVAGVETVGVGVGLGQYQNRWREFIDSEGSTFSYTTPSLKGKFDRSIPGDYKPYSVIGGMFAELGVLGLFAIILPFFLVIKDIMVSSIPIMVRYKLYCILSFVFLSFMGAYPTSMPHMWFLLALVSLESGKYRGLGRRALLPAYKYYKVILGP